MNVLTRLFSVVRRLRIRLKSKAGPNAPAGVEEVRLRVTRLEPRIVLSAAPIDIDFTGSLVSEDAADGTLVGFLSAEGHLADDAADFQLTDDADGRFEIVDGRELHVAPGAVFDIATNGTHSIAVQFNDPDSGPVVRAFDIDVVATTEVLQLPNSAFTDDGLTIREDSGSLLFLNSVTGAEVATSVSLVDVRLIELQGRDGLDDSLTLDLDSWNHDLQFEFHGGTGGNDSLQVTGASATEITAVFDSATDGALKLDSTAIHFSSVDPLGLSINASSVDLFFSDSSDQIELSRGGSPGILEVHATAGESLEFLTPDDQLRLFAGGGDDTIDVGPLGFLANDFLDGTLVIDGQSGTDVLNFDSALTLRSNESIQLGADTLHITEDLSVSGTGEISLFGITSDPADTGSIHVSARLESGLGTALLTADDSIEFVAGGQITTGGGAVELLANADGDAVSSAIFASGTTITSTGGNIRVAMIDSVIDGIWTAGSGTIRLEDGGGLGIGLGTTPLAGGLNLTGSELAPFRARNLEFATAGPVLVTDLPATATASVTGQVIIDSAAAVIFDGSSSFDSLRVLADSGITVQGDLVTAGPLVLKADEDSGATSGVLAVTSTGSIDTGNGSLQLSAADVDVRGTINAGTSGILLEQSSGSLLGLGMADAAGQLTLSLSELALFSGDRLLVQSGGDILVDGLTTSATQGLDRGIVLLAQQSITLGPNASTFNQLEAQAEDQILVLGNITTTAGPLTLISDSDNADDTFDNIVFADGVVLESAAELNLQSADTDTVNTRAKMLAEGSLTLLAVSSVLLNNSLVTNGLTVINTDTNADGVGDLVLISNSTLQTQDNELLITANNVRLDAPAVVSFQDGAFPTSGYFGTSDTNISRGQPTTNLGSDDTLTVDGLFESVTLIRWDLSSLNPGTQIVAADLTFNVLDSTTDVFQIYEVIRPWNELEATWGLAETGVTWGAGGATSRSDIDATLLGTISTNSVGLQVFNLNSAGLNVVEEWIADPSTNHGFAIQNLRRNDAVVFSSSEWGQSTLRPKITLEFVPTNNSSDPPAILDAGTGRITIIDSDGTGIGLGDAEVLNGLNLDKAHLTNIRSGDLVLQTVGEIHVDNVAEADSDKIQGTLYLESGSSVTFENAGSTFNALSVTAANGILVGANLTADTGDLALLSGQDPGNTAAVTTIPVGTVVSADSGNVLLSAQDLDLQGQVVAGGGTVRLETPVSDGINLGDGTLTGAMLVTQDELNRIEADTLIVESAGPLRVDGVDGTAFVNSTTLAGESITFASHPSVFTELTLLAEDGITVSTGLESRGPLFLNADTDADDHIGTLTITATGSVNSNQQAISQIAADMVISGSLDAGTAHLSISTPYADGIGIGTGNIANGLNLSPAEIQRITAGLLEVQSTGPIQAGGISSTDSSGIDGWLFTANQIEFLTGSFIVDDLIARANDGIVIRGSITTTTGSLQLDADFNQSADTSDRISFTASAQLNSAEDLVLSSRMTMSAVGGLTLIADRTIRLNQSLSSAGNVTIRADADQDRDGRLEFADGTVLSTTNAAIDITAADIVLGSGTTINSGTADLTVAPSSSVDIGIGDGITSSLTNPLLISQAEFNALLTTGTLSIGNLSTGDILVRGVDAGSRTLHLISGGELRDETGGASNLTTLSTLTVTALGGVGHTPGNLVGGFDFASAGLDVRNSGNNSVIVTGYAPETVLSVEAGNSTTVTVDQSAGSLRIDQINASAAAVSLTSSTAIDDHQADLVTDIVAASLTLVAGTGIGSIGPLELSTQVLDAITAQGTISLSNSAAGTISVSRLETTTGSIVFQQTAAAAVTIDSVSTTDGDLTISNQSGDLTIGTATAAGLDGDVLIQTTAMGNIAFDAISASDSITIVSAGRILEAPSDTNADLTAPTIDLAAATGIGVGNRIELQGEQIRAVTVSGDVRLANSSTAPVIVSELSSSLGQLEFIQSGGGSVEFSSIATSAGSILLDQTGADLTVVQLELTGSGQVVEITTQTSGNVAIGRIAATGNTVQITSAGSVLDQSTDDGPGNENVVADRLAITAVTGIGVTADSLESVVSELAATTHSGSIVIDNGQDLTLTTLGATSGLRILDPEADDSQADVIEVRTSGSLTVDAAVENADGGDVTLQAVTPGAGISIQDSILLSDGDGSLSLIAADSIEIVGVELSVEGTGGIELVAGEDRAGVLPVGGSNEASITMLSGSSLSAAAGNLILSATGDVQVTTLSTTGSIWITADDNRHGLNNDLGRISDGSATEDLNLSAGTIVLSAGNGIGSPVGEADLDLSAQAFEAVNSGTGPIAIESRANGVVTAGPMSTGGGSILVDHTGTGLLQVTAAVTSGDATTDGGDITIHSGGGLELIDTVSTASGTGGILSISGGVLVGASPVLGAGDIFLSATTLDLVIDSAITTESTLNLSALRDILVRAPVIVNGSVSDLFITADLDQDGSGGVLVESGGQLSAGRDVVVSGSDLFIYGSSTESVVIEATAAVMAVSAGRDATLRSSAAAPPLADVVIDQSAESARDLSIQTTGALNGTGLITATSMTLSA